MAISQDGTRVISGSNDTAVRIWDTKTGALLHKLQGYSHVVASVAISNDGTHVVSGSYDNAVHIWDTQTGLDSDTRVRLRHSLTDAMQNLNGHSDFVTSITISQDGIRIISGSSDKTICIWDTQIGTALRKLEGHSDAVASVAISHDGARIISGSDDKTIRIWDAQTGATLRKLEGHSNVVSSVTISQDGTCVVSGSGDMTVRIWDAHTGAVLRELQGHSGFVGSIAISQDGALIISGSSDSTVHIWCAKTGLVLRRLKPEYSGLCTSVAISPDGNRAMASYHQRTIVWDARTGVRIHTLNTRMGSSIRFGTGELAVTCHAYPSLVSPHGHSKLAEANQIPLYNIENGWITKDRRRLRWIPQSYRNATAEAFSPSVVAFGKASGEIQIIHMPTARTVDSSPS
jgi:WD40 repeat protein